PPPPPSFANAMFVKGVSATTLNITRTLVRILYILVIALSSVFIALKLYEDSTSLIFYILYEEARKVICNRGAHLPAHLFQSHEQPHGQFKPAAFAKASLPARHASHAISSAPIASRLPIPVNS